MYWLGGFLVIVFVIPNATNFKERRAFSDRLRIENAMTAYDIRSIADSVIVVPGSYYKRGKFATLFLGEKQRDLWTTPVKVKVFDYEETKGGLEPLEFGGGQQTISIKMEDKEGKKWALRSVNKDQKYVLSKFMRLTFMRYLFRDQLASANPYGQLVVPVMSEAIGIHYTQPQLVFVPYDERYGEFNQRMAGRLAYLEENLNSSWKKRERFGEPDDIVNTEEMMEMQQEERIPIDTLLYLKSRLFDMLVSDWDRHEGNWEWALSDNESGKVFEPIPKDRDNVFYQFDEGLLSHVTLLFTDKLQSFRKDFGSVAGLMHQSLDLDRRMLKYADKADYERMAGEIQEALTDEVISTAFSRYPPNVPDNVVAEHKDILKTRLKALPQVAVKFHDLVKKK